MTNQSDNGAKKYPLAKAQGFVSRASRIPVLGLHNVQFSIHLPSVDVFNFHLKNLSTSGLGFDPCGQEEYFGPGQSFEAKIHLGNQTCTFKIEVRYRNQNIVGCHVEDSTFDYQKIVSDYFKEELMAMEMKEIDPKLLKEDPDGEPRLFFGGPHCSVYYTVANDVPTKFKINFMGNSLKSAQDGKMIFSYGDEDDSNDLDIELELFELPEDTLLHIIRFIQSIPGLPRTHEDWLVSYLQHSNSESLPKAA